VEEPKSVEVKSVQMQPRAWIMEELGEREDSEMNNPIDLDCMSIEILVEDLTNFGTIFALANQGFGTNKYPRLSECVPITMAPMYEFVECSQRNQFSLQSVGSYCPIP